MDQNLNEIPTEKPHDLVIFGASGFTGRYVLETVVNYLRSDYALERGEKFSYAAAARSKSKLDSVLKSVSESTGQDLSKVPRIIADVSDSFSLIKMANSAKIVLNCVGPYRFGGKEVVEACIAGKASCVDISGEPEYLELVQLDCFEAAKNAGVYIVGSCGFDSIPADLGTLHLSRNFDGGELNSVEEYVETENKGKKPSKINYGTWAPAVHGLANAKNLRPIGQALFKIEPKPPRPKYRLEPRSTLHHSEVVHGWCLPFMGSDRSVVVRSQNLLYRLKNQRPVQVHAYVKQKSWFAAIGLILGGILFMLFVKLPCGLGRSLLLGCPGCMSCGNVSRKGPKKDEIENLEFTVTLYGKGWADKLPNPQDQHEEPPKKTKIVKVQGRNPGYGATCVCLLQSALTILYESDKMPLTGGVYPPAAAFSETSLIQRLNENGVIFEIQGSPAN